MIHYTPTWDGPLTACGIDRRTAGELGFTNHKVPTTCPACKESAPFKQAVQRIPTIPAPAGYKHV